MPNNYPPLDKLKKSGEVLKSALSLAKSLVNPGISTKEIDDKIHQLIVKAGCYPTFLGYDDFPAATCISVNDEIVHCVPSERVLENGDIISIDCGVTYDGAITDSCITLPVGNVAPRTMELLEITEKALWSGISYARVGNRIGDISYNIQKTVENAGFNVSRDFVGHCITEELHSPPWIENYGKKGTGKKLEAGMVLAIEPIVFDGDFTAFKTEGWNIVSKYGNLSAHFEHTVYISEEGPIIVTDKCQLY